LEEIKMDLDNPEYLLHEIFTRGFWPRHALGRPILGTPETVGAFDSANLRAYFGRTYLASNLVVAAAGHLDHATFRALVNEAFAALPAGPRPAPADPPLVTPGIIVRQKDIEQSHLCLGTPGYSQTHDGRHALYVLNTILGGSMSSRLFQHIREDRGLAYAVFSNLTAYSDAGAVTIYAGCASEKVGEVVDLTLAELRALRDDPVGDDEIRRAKDHLKGSLMLSLESTSSRMSQLARHEIYFGRHFSLDEILLSIERVSVDDVQRVARDLFTDGALTGTLVGPGADRAVLDDRLRI
jgi:predicted Zn-dependent peptidase